MRKLMIIPAMAATLLLQSCWVRLGDLNMVSNRNYDESAEYVELQRYVSAKGKKYKHKSGAMEDAIDNAIKCVTGGEFMTNVKVETKNRGKRVRVTGDVWGKKRPQ